MNKIDEIYYDLCYKLLKHGNEVKNTKELNNIQIELNDINENIVSIRNISPAYLFGEWIWYFTGRNSTKFISSFGSMWEKLSDDGKTNNSAYGYLMKYAYQFDQIETIIELLTRDPESRRAVINLNVPNPNVIFTKDEPCTIALQFLIRNGKLNCTAIMRSNDIWYGFPYDVAFFTELQKYIADKLMVEYGTYTHFVTSLHLYEKNYKDIQKIVNNAISKPIYLDRKKFHENVELIGDLIEVLTCHCDSDQIKDTTLTLAKEFFDFRQEENNIEDKNN